MRTDLIGRTATSMPKRHQLADFVPAVVHDMRTSSTDPTPAMVSVATNATAHTKGAWVEIVAAAPSDVDIIELLIANTAAAAVAGGALMDVGVGAAGSEVVIAPDVGVGNSSSVNLYDCLTVSLPVAVRSGSRIAVRWQAARASATSASVAMRLFRWPSGAGLRSPSKLDAIGVNTSTTAGTSAGATSNVWTSVGTAARAYQGFVAVIMSNDATMAAASAAVDVGVGASGSERAWTGDSVFNTFTTEIYRATYGSGGTFGGFVALNCPAGASISVRVRDSQQSNNNPAVCLMGVPYA